MRFLAAILLLVQAVVAAPTFTRTAAPTGWTLGSRATPSSPVSFSLALRQRNLDWLNAQFESVSNPDSPMYRQFMSRDEVLSMIQPSNEDKNTVKKWLNEAGVDTIKDLGDSFECTTTVDIAEPLFRTFFHTYTSTEDTSISLVRTYGSYSLDDTVSPLVDMITGLASFPIPHLRAQKPIYTSSSSLSSSSSSSSPSATQQGIVAQTLEKIYGIPSSLSLSTNTSQGVIEFEDQFFAPKDLSVYATDVSISVPPLSAKDIVGTNDPTAAGTEATLDVDMMFTVNHEAQNWFWIESGTGWLYTFATHFFSTSSVPQVVSISYGWSEADQCSIAPDECSQLGVTPQQYVVRVNIEFQKIGLRGVTLLSASGDSGANGRTDGDCTSKQLFPDFPGSSPYVLSVGATELKNPIYGLTNLPPICSGKGYECPSDGTEEAVSYSISGFASGGGFSNIAVTPTWQQTAVTAYLKSGVVLPPSTYFNATSRAYPDVAAIGHNNLIYQAGIQAVGGTSASAPIWGAIISLLNQAAMTKDNKPLGFVNPLLYKIASVNAQAFRDITIGDNKCTENGCATTCKGFLATKGWDPVTGLGAPNFPALLSYVQNNL